MNRALSRMAWASWALLAKVAGRAYVAGPKLDDALQACRALSARGYPSCVCFWDTQDDSSEQVAEACQAALTAIASETLDCYLSVKLPPLRRNGDMAEAVLEQARRQGALVHFDSLGPEAAEETFAVIAEAARRGSIVGCTLPGRWLRSCSDADLAVELGLHVRVVKGQWEDPDDPGIDLREGFLKVIDRLAGRARAVAVATHDAELSRAALERLRQAGTPCTLELLYGLPVRRSLRVARALGTQARVYVPFGHGWLPYTLTQARRNPRIVWWVLRDMMTRGPAFPSPSEE
jgi:proline dehydrogenase